MKAALRSWIGINPAALAITVVLVVIGLFVWGIPILDLIELKTYDLRFRSRGPRQPSPAVIMAAIDEKSLDAEGRWPWPRSKIAALVDALSQDGARVIAFDIGFSEPDENSQLALVDEMARQVQDLGITEPRLRRFIQDTRRSADNDLALASAIKRSSAAVVLGYFFHDMTDATLEYRFEASEIQRRLETLASSKYPVVIYENAEARKVRLPRAYAPETNLATFTGAAAASGFFSLRSDPDGVLRWMPLVIQAGEELFPPLSVVAAWQYLGRPPLTVRIGRHGVEGLQIGDRHLPTDEGGQLLINYLGPARTFAQVSVTDILNGRVPPGTFKDRLVLVGATALGTFDLRTTPFGSPYPGMEVHASVIDNILTRNFMARPEWSKIFDILAIVVVGAVLGAALPRLSPILGVVYVMALAIVFTMSARWLFLNGIWLNMVYPLLTVAVAYTALTVYYYVTEQRQRKQVKSTFRQYVAPLVVEEMLKDPKRLKLGGEVKVLTVLFSDLEGFTTYSERFGPDEMARMLSDYYDRVTEQVFIHRGTLKEYVGDELMAIFGAPLAQEDHAVRACAAALAMREQRLALAAEWAGSGRPGLKARTGINSGAMLVGNLGSKFRFAYGVLGDEVNLASRLEGLNKAYGTEILIGENTARLVQGKFALREVDLVRVLGRSKPVCVFELVNRLAHVAPEVDKAAKAYAAGLEAYRQRVWEEALALFSEALALCPTDGPSRTMSERCRIYQTTPPAEEWDGVFEQAFKK